MARTMTCRCRETHASAQAPARSCERARPVVANTVSQSTAHLSLALGESCTQRAQGARSSAQARVASVRQVQRMLGNRAAQHAVLRLLAQPARGAPAPGADAITVQRDSFNPLDWARNLLNEVSGDATAQQAQVGSEASARAGEMETRGATESASLQGEADAQGAALQGEAVAGGPLVDQQAAMHATALQNHAQTQGARLNADSSARAAALQQVANGMSARLQGDVGALDNTARATESTAEGTFAVDAAGLQGEAEASAAASQAQWGGLERDTTGRVARLNARTQALADQKTALVNEYESPGAHDPERFQRRWADLQQQVGPLEQEQSSLGGVEGAGEAISERAETAALGLGKRAEALFTRASGVASQAWGAAQERWSALQGTAAAGLAGVQAKLGAAAGGLRSLADQALGGLRGAAAQASSALKDFADGASSRLQARASAVSAALQGRATAAWSSLQGLAGSVTAILGNRISGIVSRISGAVGRIVSLIADAVGSMLARLRSATASALDSLRERASAAWNAVKGAGSRAFEGLKSLGSRAWEALKSTGARAWDAVKRAGAHAWDILSSLGTRAWEALRSLGERAWSGLKSGWDALKQRAQAAWTWLKGAWEKIKRKAGEAWAWIKAKAKQALVWLKQKWAWLKAIVRKAWDWLKAKWRWLKGLVKIKIRLPDQTLCKHHNFKPWKFVDLHSGRLPIAKTVVDPGIGPVELALFVQGDAEATIGGTVGPCSLKNIMFTLQPLISRYTGEADFHVPATVTEKLVLTGTIGGSANYGGLIALAGGGLEGTGTASAIAAFSAKPRFVYDSGKITTTVPIRLDFCVMPTIDLDAFVLAQLRTGKPPSAPPPPTPIIPGPMPTLPGGSGPSLPRPGLPAPGPILGSPALAAGAGTPPATESKPEEELLKEWKARWRLASWSKRECWDAQARFTITSGPGGLPDIDVEFSARPISLAEVIRRLFDLPPLPFPHGGGGGGGGGGFYPFGQTYACAICKCSGDVECGGGRIHTIWMGKTECNRENNAKAQQLCNHDPTFLSICDLNQKRKDGKKCMVHHHDFACGDRETEEKCSNRQKSAVLFDPTLTHETEYAAPDGSGNARTEVGVGEQVTFTGSVEGKWTATGGTPTTLARGGTFKWTAPDRAASVDIKLEAAGKSASVSMNVIEPASITGKKVKELSYSAGRQGAGMKLKFNYHPMNVSFGNADAKEVSGPASNITGYFLKHGMPHWHDSGDTFFPIGKDNKDTATDEASFSGYPQPWDKGGWDWHIPNHFKTRTEGGDGKRFTTVTQSFSMTADGTSTVDKAGESVTRSP